jgi:GcrA cell cycle regulator
MSRWTAEEIRELVTLWPTSTAAQIAYRLHRPRATICGKAKRLLKEGLLEGKNAKNPNPRKRRRRARPLRIWIMLPPPPPPVNDSLAMRPCSLLELDEARCHWPLGDVNEVATEFCGGAPAPGHRYCRHHMRMAHGQGSDAGHAARY